jgi:hypothetical protein
MPLINQPAEHLLAELAATRRQLNAANATIAKLQGEREAATATILDLTIALQAATQSRQAGHAPALQLGGSVLERFCWN